MSKRYSLGVVGRSPTSPTGEEGRSPTGEEGRVTSLFTGLFPAASAVEDVRGLKILWIFTAITCGRLCPASVKYVLRGADLSGRVSDRNLRTTWIILTLEML